MWACEISGFTWLLFLQLVLGPVLPIVMLGSTFLVLLSSICHVCLEAWLQRNVNVVRQACIPALVLAEAMKIADSSPGLSGSLFLHV